MVASRSGKRPHLVTKTTNGKFSCDKECPNWTSIGVCSYCIAVAQVNGKLQEIVNLSKNVSDHPTSRTCFLLAYILVQETKETELQESINVKK